MAKLEAKDLRLHNIVGCKVSNDHGIYQIEALGGYKRVFDSKEDERIYNLDLDAQIKCKKASSWHDERMVKLNGVRSGEKYLESQIKGVKLTEEWLIKFGFKRIGSYYQIENNNYIFSIEIRSKNLLCISGEIFNDGEFEILQTIKYVHELQNLYFILTRDELTTNKN